MRSSEGVVVEGPPGTGKSHTIANLICHLLASGKRVLVTSHTARALQVLRKMIPESIRPLCVEALANDARELEMLEASVKGITDKYLNWDASQNATDIERLQAELHQTRKELQKLLHEARAIREIETYKHENIAQVYSGTLGQIACRIKEESDTFGIINDDIPLDGIPPCTVQEFDVLLEILKTDAQIENMGNEPPNPEYLIKPVEFEKIVNEIKKAEQNPKLDIETPDSLFECIANVASDIRTHLRENLSEFVNSMQELLKRPENWIEEALWQVLSGRDRKWIELLNFSQQKIKELNSVSNEVINAQISGYEDQDWGSIKVSIDNLMDYRNRKNWFDIRFGPFLPKDVKSAQRMLKPVHVNGNNCESAKELDLLYRRSNVMITLHLLQTEWGDLLHAWGMPVRQQIKEFEDSCEPLEVLSRLLARSNSLSTILRENQITPPKWSDEKDLTLYLSTFDRATAIESLRELKKEYDDRVQKTRELLSELGKKDLLDLFSQSSKQMNLNQYADFFSRYISLFREWQRRNTAVLALRKINNVAPAFKQELLEQPNEEKWTLLKGRWEESWRWSATRKWINDMTSSHNDIRLAKQIKDEQNRINLLLEKLAAAKAWSYCFQRLSESQRQSLHAWANAVKKIGRTGKGKYAGQHRREAREHMAQCRNAIPAWIMPMYRVAESMRPDTIRFDVAIIDEASQSGIEALALLFLTDRILVVGDDKQISPDPFTKVEDVNRLRDEFIADLPMSDIFDHETSLFDIAKIRYKTRVRLVEHFRCMPEIIQFSNDLCYSTEPLIPLKQYGAGRLEPVLYAFHVKDGYVKGESKKVNPPEARAIANQISRLLKDERYKKKTFGVISLLGSTQARLIEKELLSLCDIKELNERLLICGDAYDFQGDERDVMFLSFVVAPSPDKRIPALADPKWRDTRRYNVAMSRAKDQVWLFHSATLNDLNPNDLRARLLKYCLNPADRHKEAINTNLDKLLHRPYRADRLNEKPPPPFESWFEVDVYLRIANKNYTIVPQYEIHGYRIDFAIIGHRSKMAIECDGEYWHGPEKWEEDAARQRDLERCGWPFFRIRESHFRLDPEESLLALWEELNRQGILPRGEEVPRENDISETVIEIEEKEENVAAIDYEAQDSTLPEYEEWAIQQVPHPGGSREAVINALCSIVRTEGPMTWRRVFELYRLGLGMRRLKGTTRKALETAAKHTCRRGHLVEWHETNSKDWYSSLVRTPEKHCVVLRQRGPRHLEDVPPSEIAELIRQRQLYYLSEELTYRMVLATYGLRKLTATARHHLQTALLLAIPTELHC